MGGLDEVQEEILRVVMLCRLNDHVCQSYLYSEETRAVEFAGLFLVQTRHTFMIAVYRLNGYFRPVSIRLYLVLQSTPSEIHEFLPEMCCAHVAAQNFIGKTDAPHLNRYTLCL